MKDTLRQITVLVSVLATVVFNLLANALPLNGLNTGEISDRFQVYFVPAGYVFAVWGVIYIGLIAYAVFQALPSQRENPRLRRTGYLVAASGLANGAWLFLWHYELFPPTLVAMFALLLLLIAVYLRLGTGRTAADAAEIWATRVPISVYLGWITVAAVANVTDVLYFLDWDGFGLSPQAWMLIVLGAVVLVSGLVGLTRRDLAFNLVVLWALVGIAVKHSGAALVFPAVLAAAVLVLAILLLSLPRRTALHA